MDEATRRGLLTRSEREVLEACERNGINLQASYPSADDFQVLTTATGRTKTALFGHAVAIRSKMGWSRPRKKNPLLHQQRALTAFLNACQGPDPDVDALGWLSALLAEVEDSGFMDLTEDVEAVQTAIRESRALLDGLRAAVEMMRGEG